MDQLEFDDLRDLPPMVSFPLAARLMGMGLTHAYKLRSAGQFPLTLRKHGKNYVVPRSELLEYVGAIPQRATA